MRKKEEIFLLKNRTQTFLLFIFYIGIAFMTSKLIFNGSVDTNKVSTILEKISTINLTLIIGYSALIAAIIAIAPHNTRQHPDTKKLFETFIFFTIVFILMNISLLITSFIVDSYYNPMIGRILVGLIILQLLILSHLVLSITRKIIY